MVILFFTVLTSPLWRRSCWCAVIKGANERGGNGREATQFLQSATLALGVCIHIASVADPQLWFINHFHQPQTFSQHIVNVHEINEINAACYHHLNVYAGCQIIQGFPEKSYS